MNKSEGFLLYFSKIHGPLTPQGVIDVDKEITKLESNKDTLGKQLKKLQDAAAVPTYETKVPEEVRNKNAEKVIVPEAAVCLQVL